MTIPRELLEMLGRGKESDLPIPEAQRMELCDALTQWNEPVESFNPGDFVEAKPLFQTMTIKPELMFWRYLDLSDPRDMAVAVDWLENHCADGIDCLVAYIAPQGGCVIMQPFAARALRKEKP